ncbi:PAP2 superfamily-domain-containing protein [Coniochaeta sp. 2T2.1]|nr:PAP2 superfamily-domain-containing protein [Coniochaeta sp. 2T2.1]
MASRKKGGWVLAASYVSDWIILIATAVVGFVLGNITPNKRPFHLEDPDISLPYTVHETVPVWLLMVCSVLIPAILIAIIAIVFVPGATVPKGTPKSLIWKRKLWELHTGLLGLALSLVAAWFITNGMKNLFGKPRPDLLSRCQPDIANLATYVVGGIANISSNGQLVSAAICTNTDKYVMDDGFRSYPSGHSSSSAAGLIYLSLFIASKFAITIPFLAYSSYTDDTQTSVSAFPSRVNTYNNNLASSTPLPYKGGDYELTDHHRPGNRGTTGDETLNLPSDPALKRRLEAHSHRISAARRQAAAPPLYLLLLCAIPFFGAIFIASSRWFDFRHHGFDILFGFFIGTVTAFFAFRYYHLPIGRGAGWAWGPRSRDKAFWAGVGSFSFATDRELHAGFWGGEPRAGDEEEAVEGRGVGNGFGPVGSGSSRGETAAVGRKNGRVERVDYGDETRV